MQVDRETISEQVLNDAIVTAISDLLKISQDDENVRDKFYRWAAKFGHKCYVLGRADERRQK